MVMEYRYERVLDVKVISNYGGGICNCKYKFC